MYFTQFYEVHLEHVYGKAMYHVCMLMIKTIAAVVVVVLMIMDSIKGLA
jgi:hypothetical protein